MYKRYSRYSAIYDKGSSNISEDGFFLDENSLFGVLDGYSAPYSPEHPLQKFNGLSGGEMIVRLSESFVANAKKKVFPNTLREFVLQMNEAVLKEQERFNINTADLAGASFAFARLKKQCIEIVQAGDCLAILELKNGQVIVTPNQVRRHDEVMHAEIERLMREVANKLFGPTPLEEIPREKLAQVRGEMWNLFYPILRKSREKNANREYGVLNGQPELANMLWERSFSKEIKIILLLSDGMIPWAVMKSTNDEELGPMILTEFKRCGLAGLLLWARNIEKQVAATAYINQAEATAISIEF